MKKYAPLKTAYMVSALLAVLLMALPICLHSYYYGLIDGEWKLSALPDISYFNVTQFNSPLLFASYGTVIVLMLTLIWGIYPASSIKSSILTLLTAGTAVSSIYVFKFFDRDNITVWSCFISALLVICTILRIWSLIKLLADKSRSGNKSR